MKKDAIKRPFFLIQIKKSQIKTLSCALVAHLKTHYVLGYHVHIRQA